MSALHVGRIQTGGSRRPAEPEDSKCRLKSGSGRETVEVRKENFNNVRGFRPSWLRQSKFPLRTGTDFRSEVRRQAAEPLASRNFESRAWLCSCVQKCSTWTTRLFGWLRLMSVDSSTRTIRWVVEVERQRQIHSVEPRRQRAAADPPASATSGQNSTAPHPVE